MKERLSLIACSCGKDGAHWSQRLGWKCQDCLVAARDSLTHDAGMTMTQLTLEFR